MTRPEDRAAKRILILCTGNSARSQMAAGFLAAMDSGLAVYSAGTAPAARVNPYAIRVMEEVGLDISRETPRHVQQFLDGPFDYVISVCDDADRNCPIFAGRVGKRTHIGFIDPAAAAGTDGEIMAVFRRVRDEIRSRFAEFYKVEIQKVS